MSEAPKTRARRPEAQTQTLDSEWVSEMQEHFQRRGFYRAQDLERVLGNPRSHVQVRTTSDPANFLAFR